MVLEFFLLCLCGQSGLPAAAATSPSLASARGTSADAPISLDEAISLTLQYNESIRLAQADYTRASGDVTVAAAPLKPTLILTESSSYQGNNQVVSLGPKTYVISQRANSQFNLESLYNVDLFGAQSAAVSQADLERRSAAASIGTAVNNAVDTTIHACCELLLDAKNVDVSQSEVSQNQANYSAVMSRRTAGEAAANEEDEAKSDLAAAQDRLVSDQGILSRQRLAFLAALGLSPSTDPILTKPINEAKRDDRSFQDLLDVGLKSQPEVCSAYLNLQAAQKGLKIARTTSDPTVSIGVSTIYNPSPSSFSPSHADTIASLNIAVPLYDGGLRRGKVLAAKSDIESASEILREQRDQVASDIASAESIIAEASSHQSSASARVAAAQEGMHYALERYKQGLANGFLEVSTATSTLTAAQRDQASADSQMHEGQADLSRAIGTYASSILASKVNTK
jgi:outer membrane protein TolC